jgi:hypothetical protein
MTAFVAAGSRAGFTEYLLSDIDGQTAPTAHLTHRVTLAPLIPLSVAEDSSTFHRALHYFNGVNCRQSTWDELTVSEQDAVRLIYAKLKARQKAIPAQRRAQCARPAEYVEAT